VLKFFGFKSVDVFVVIEKWFASNGILILLIIFIIINVIKFYSLWKEREKVIEYNNLPESYKRIVEKMDRLIPDKSNELRQDFAIGYKCLYANDCRDINTAVAVYFAAYKKIQDFLINYLNNLEITEEMLKIISKFDSNFSKLENYNINIGTNNGLLDDIDVQKLIKDINNNLNSLISYI
jgi:hypothetical protein